MKKKLLKRILLIVLIIIVLSLVSFYVWTQNTYEAIEDPQLMIESEVQLEDDWLVYPAENADKGIIIYPGAKVEPDAYAYLAQELSKQNITVAIPNVMLHLPIFDISKADEMIQTNEDIDWYIGGHSMGGAAAAMYTDGHIDAIEGLVLLGAYAASNDVLSQSDLPVLSISGSEDGLSTPQKLDENSSHLPQSTEFIEIDGGNHAYFGVYGSQSGDNEAQITVAEQQTLIIDTIVDWMNELDGAQGGT